MSDFDTYDTLLVYDCRTFYANIMGALLTQLAEMRYVNNYVKCYKLLQEIFAHIRQKLSDEEINEWYVKNAEVVKVLNLYPQAYIGKSTQKDDLGKVLDAINILHFWLYKKMEEKNIFGRANRPARI